jgi:hypothetical protein
MKVFHLKTFAAIISTLTDSNVHASSMERTLRGGIMHGQEGGRGFGQGGQQGHHGGSRGPPPFMQAMIKDKCLNFDCDAITDTTNIDCTIPMPDSPEISSMTKSMLDGETEESNQRLLYCACCHSAIPGDEGDYGFGNHHGGQGGHSFMQMMIQEECDTLKCDDIGTDDLNCNIERPDRPNFATMTEEEKEDAWVDMQVDREEHHQQILQCACCANVTIEELFPVDEGGDSFHAFGSRPGHGYHHNHHHDQSSEDENVDGMMGEYQNEMTSSSSYDGFGMGHYGGKGHQNGSNRPKRNKVEHILETQCPNHSCPNANNGGDSEAESSITCPRLDEVMAMTKEERRQTTLDCVCCRDDGMSELEDLNDEVEVSVLLSSLMPAAASSAESGEQINAGAHDVVTFVSGLAATALLIVIA